MSYRGRTVGVAVPAYNEEELIEDTLMSIPEYVDRVYVIDDCSEDLTADIVRDFAVTNPRVMCVSHKMNSGVGATIVTGFKNALDDKIDIVTVMAGDNQMDPTYLPNLIDPIIDGEAEFTKGNRLISGYWEGMSSWRLAGNIMLNILTKIASGYWHVDDPQNGYIAISRNSLSKLDLNKLYKGYAFENDMMIKANIAGINLVSVPIPARYGRERSKIIYKKFILKTSFFLFASFIWRVWKKYVIKGHPIGVLYMVGCFGILLGILLLIAGKWDLLLISAIIFILSCFWEMITSRPSTKKKSWG